MAFITRSDIITALYEDELGVITRKNETVFATTIDIAIAEAKLYLTDRYDCKLIFAQLGEARNMMLVNICIDICIYKLIAASAAGQSYQDRKDRYDRAIAILKMIQKAEIVADLPAKPISAGVNRVTVTILSEPKRRNNL
jgi:phage gp36-like protein